VSSVAARFKALRSRVAVKPNVFGSGVAATPNALESSCNASPRALDLARAQPDPIVIFVILIIIYNLSYPNSYIFFNLFKKKIWFFLP
jgi:hypothetical protein